MPNPLDLTGPQFLLFYIVFAGVIIMTVRFARRGLEAYPFTEGAEHKLAEDPYAIALLNSGRAHCIYVAVMSLLDRGLLKVSKKKVQTADGLKSVAIARRPLEKAILQRCMTSTSASLLPGNSNIAVVCEEMEATLRGAGLLPAATDTSRRVLLLCGGLLVLVGMSVMKIQVALARGHHNIGFLILFTIVAGLVLNAGMRPRRTMAGDRMVERLRLLFLGLQHRVNELPLGGESNDFALLAALYGITILPPAITGELRPLGMLPTAKTHSSSNFWDFSSGSSCGVSSAGSGGGDSSGGGGGSSCGGGGGCGGCGG